MNAVETHELRKTFDGRLILDNLSITVGPGDVYGFLGPNGSGKTTTLRILVGLLAQDRGSVSVLGLNPQISADQLHRKINLLPESHGIYGWMSPQGYLRFFAQLYGVFAGDDDCARRLQQVGLDAQEHRPVRTFSSGMKRRLGIARAMVNNPEVLFLDEPTNGLDPRGRREIHDLLRTLNQERRMTIILSTHILDDVERLCNRIAILDRGTIRYEGAASGAMDSGAVRYRFSIDPIGPISLWFDPQIEVVEQSAQSLTCLLKDIAPADAIQRLVEQYNVRVIEAVRLSGDLEDLYLSHTGRGFNQ